MSYLRYVAIGDSFTEGVGDNDPTRPNGLRGWADRTAEVLAQAEPGFRYANLAIRGRKLVPIITEQVPRALELAPDLITFNGGGNDILRPKADIDAIAARYDEAVGELVASGARVVVFTQFDPGATGIYAAMRGRFALFNEWVREVADKHQVTLVDVWRMRDNPLELVLDEDRMHMNPVGHTLMAGNVLRAIGVENSLTAQVAEPPVRTRREQFAENARWTREFLAPWVQRRLTGRSSGDTISPKYPDLTPLGGAQG